MKKCHFLLARLTVKIRNLRKKKNVSHPRESRVVRSYDVRRRKIARMQRSNAKLCKLRQKYASLSKFHVFFFLHSAEAESPLCTYPSWLVSVKNWVALDPSASKRLIASTNNLTILDEYETRFACHTIQPPMETKRMAGGQKTGHAIASAHHNSNRVQLIAKATRDW